MKIFIAALDFDPLLMISENLRKIQDQLNQIKSPQLM
jgi:hypothetical protein